MNQQRVRYNIVVEVSSKGKRKQPFVFNKQPLRPGSVQEAFDDTVQKQYEHLGFGVKTNGLTKYLVKGIRLKGHGVDATDVVMMYAPQMKAAVVVKVVRA
jgi:hypothetical protein